MERVCKENRSANDGILVARTSMVTNMIHGSSIIRAFQLARGFYPSILGLPATTIPKQLLDSITEMKAIRLLQKVMHSRTIDSLPLSSHPPDATCGIIIALLSKMNPYNG